MLPSPAPTRRTPRCSPPPTCCWLASGEILDANAADVAQAEADGTSATVIDRLRLTAARIESMADGLRQVASLPDPVGEVLDGWVRPNGLRIQRVRVPLGVVGIIYENRPNVTTRRRRALPEVGQRRVPAWVVGRDQLEPRHRRRAARRRDQGGPARRRRHAGRRRVA